MEIEYSHLNHGKQGNKPNRIVIHCMGEFIRDPDPIHARDFLDKYKLSAHALVLSNGTIMRCRDDEEIAWHARGHNTNTLGVEFLVPGEHIYASFLAAIKDAYLNDEQWTAGIELVKSWVEDYDIPRARVVRHSDISPGRKVDPGDGFNWVEFLDTVFE